MAPSAVLSKLRNNRSDLPPSATTLPPDLAVLARQEPSALNFSSSGSQSPKANPDLPIGFSTSDSSDLPRKWSSTSLRAASSTIPNDLNRDRPSSASVDRTSQHPTARLASAAPRAPTFAFSLQPPQKFAPSFNPVDASAPSLNSGPVPGLGDQPHPGNASALSLSGPEDVSSKSASSRPGKGRIHLLNPLNLLARRRSSQNNFPKVVDAALSAGSSTVPKIPHDYDPRIRGNIVHDFSVPKASRLNSYNGLSSAETSPSVDSRPSTQGTHKATEASSYSSPHASRAPPASTHSPIFKEHFDEDRQPQPQNTGYLHSLASSPALRMTHEPPKLPAFAKSLPLDFSGLDAQMKDDARSDTKASETIISDTTKGELAMPEYPEECRLLSNNPQPPENLSGPDVSPYQQPFPAAGFLKPPETLPKHMTSTSSRFSFQLGDLGSETQERLLEEKHKQHVASHLSISNDKADSGSERSHSTNADYDGGEGIEENIPGVNVDIDQETIDPQQQNFISLHGTSIMLDMGADGLVAGSSHISPQDNDGRTVGLANTEALPDLDPMSSNLEAESKVHDQLCGTGGLGLVPPSWSALVERAIHLPLEGSQDLGGSILDAGNNKEVISTIACESSDRNSFGDDTDEIQENPSQSIGRSEFAEQDASSLWLLSPPLATGSDEVQSTPVHIPISTDLAPSAETTREEAQPREIPARIDSRGDGLTEDNLAFQNALVSAASQVEKQSLFRSHISLNQEPDDADSESQHAGSQQEPTSDKCRIGRLLDDQRQDNKFGEFAFDDWFEDDPMVAEANAEVLENDFEGFYGQEFGFFARAPSKGDIHLVNGGYFGPRGVEGVHRSHSAKAKFQEPSLTPITERSEWSHRNSLASIHTLALSQGGPAVPSLGRARLLDSPISEDDMMGTLMRLRREAWGSSQTSLGSTSGSQAGNSPLGLYPATDSLGQHPANLGNGAQGSNQLASQSEDVTMVSLKALEDEETQDDGDTAISHETVGTKPIDGKQQPEMTNSRLSSPPTPCISPPSGRSLKSHNRSSSGANSVSYTRDPEGSERWLLERRRTGDDGEPEVVGREYVAGARI